jgi:hypothetical protein
VLDPAPIFDLEIRLTDVVVDVCVGDVCVPDVVERPGETCWLSGPPVTVVVVVVVV